MQKPEEEAMVAADVMENTVMEVTNRIQADNIDNIAILFRLVGKRGKLESMKTIKSSAGISL